MSLRPTSGRFGAALLAMICLAACATPSADAATEPAVAIGTAAPTAGSLSGPAVGLATPTSGILDPLNSLASDIGKEALNALGSAVLGAAGAALQETASVIDQTTAPRLESTWFSSTYWRVAGLAALLTLPFLFAAAVQALLRSDLTLLLRAAFGYLPLAMLGVSLAAPITLLLLSVTDEMSSVVAGAGSGGGVHFLRQTAAEIVGLSGLGGSAFLGFALGFMMLGAAIALALEMLVREAAVYVVVLMLPLAFAALVWPARRVWAVRLVELLIALVLSKFVIVAVLSLAGAAYGSTGSPSVTRLLTAMALVILSTFAPWVLLRLLPFTELAAGAGAALSAELPHLSPMDAVGAADGAAAWAERLSRRLRPQSAEKSEASDSGARETGPAHTTARYAPDDPEAGSISPSPNSGEPESEEGSRLNGESAAARPAERRVGIAPPGLEPDETTRPFLGRGGTVATSDESGTIAEGASLQDADGVLSPGVIRDSPRDAGGASPPDQAGISPPAPPDDELPLPPAKAPDEGHL